MASLKCLIILCLLHLCVQSIQEDVNNVALAGMIKHFDENVQPKTKSGTKAQYAIAISVPLAQCTEEQSDIETVFSIEEAQKVGNLLSNREKCVLCTPSKNVIAARPTTKPNEHAEHILLYPEGNSPMDKLLKEADQNSCVVFYSYNSPCVTKCIVGNESILEGLKNWKNKRKYEMNVFVYNKIWEKDAWRKDLADYLLKINADNLPLYRCKSTNVMECQKCVEKNTGKIWEKDTWRNDLAKNFLKINADNLPLYRCKSTNVMECQKCVKETNTVIPFCLPERRSVL